MVPKESIPANITPKVVDVGCGSGFATISLAQHYGPNSQIYGLDLSVVPQHARDNTPLNVEWLQGNFLADLDMVDQQHRPIFKRNTFTHIFNRGLVYGIDNWPGFYSKAYDLLAPGGWIEHQDPDIEWYQLDPDSLNGRRSVDHTWGWPVPHRECMHSKGLDLYCGSHAVERMRNAGLIDVQEKEFIWAFSPVEGVVGTDVMAAYSRRGIKAVIGKICADTFPAWGWSEKIRKECLDRMEDDWFGQPGIFWRYLVVTGRKPTE